jgi:hypothetical protein
VAGTARQALGERDRDVHGLLAQDARVALGLELGLAGRECLLHAAAGGADALAGVLAGGRRQGADLAVGERERAAVARVVEAGALELVEVRGGGDGVQRLGDVLLELVLAQRRHLDGIELGVGT